MISCACHERFVDAAVPEMQVRRNGRSLYDDEQEKSLNTGRRKPGS
jgi:hypothetical protein